MRQKLLAIDYGLRRAGLAVSDEGTNIAFGLCGIDTSKLQAYLQDYLQQESISSLIVGLPKTLSDGMNELEKDIQAFIASFQKKYPNIPVERIDERLTSVMAERTIASSTLPRNKRQNKYLVDEVSAILILQQYLDNKLLYS